VLSQCAALGLILIWFGAIQKKKVLYGNRGLLPDAGVDESCDSVHQWWALGTLEIG